MSNLLGFFQSSPETWVVLVGVLGLTVGSFLNVVIHRLPKIMERSWRIQCAELRQEAVPESPAYNLVRPGSSCPHCGHRITALENIPLLSYAFLKGRCIACRKPIGLRYPLVEALSALLSAYAAWRFGVSIATAGALILVWAAIALTFIDLDTQLLPDSLTLPLLWAGLLFNIVATFTDLQSSVVGAAAGYLALWTIYWLFKLTTGKEGMGYGDFKLLGAIGAWLGWKMLPLVILLSSMVGATVGIVLIVAARRGRNVPIPFGPYLAGGGLIALFWGEPLLRLYLG